MGSCTTPAAAGRRPVAIDTLEVILKTVERCNIACRYCYFFFGGDTSYERHPPCITRATVNEVAGFLKAGAVDLGIDKLQIDFHGGEPLMQKLCDFDWMC